MIEALCIGLIALNAFQLWIWWREIHRLIDKVMSRNYAEYVTSQKFSRPDLPQGPEFLAQENSDQNEEQDLLRELNGMIIT